MANPRLHVAAGKITRAQFNTGYTAVANSPGRTYRVVDCSLRAIGGNSNCTAAVIKTGHGTPVTIWSCNHGNLTENTLFRPSIASGGTHAIGAGFNANLPTGGGIVIKPSGTESSASHIEYVIQYVLVTP